MSVNERMGGFIFLLIKRVRIWRRIAAKREQYTVAVSTVITAANFLKTRITERGNQNLSKFVI